MIPEEVIEQFQPAILSLHKGAFLFLEGEQARFYFQVITGQVQMLNVNAEGKEFVQGTFQDGQSFGEPPLFHDAHYPASARAEAPTRLYKLGKDKLIDLLLQNPEIHLNLTKTLTKRLMYKAMIMKEISSHDARHRILTFLDHLKEEYSHSKEPFHVALTRQQLSNLLGIRVETVIRTIKMLADEGEIELKGRKIFR